MQKFCTPALSFGWVGSAPYASPRRAEDSRVPLGLPTGPKRLNALERVQCIPSLRAIPFPSHRLSGWDLPWP